MRNRILVVDDSHYAADASARLISVCGYETRAVYSGREAVEQIAVFAPDMVLMDIAMTDMDGYEAAAQIRRDPQNADILLVAVTCLNGEKEKQQAYESGFNLHVPKPISLTTLHGLLAILHQRRGPVGAARSGVSLTSG
jgi:CheY-like chemotaxis protein